MKSICILPNYQGIGGPASFQARLINGLKKHGIETHHDPARADCAAILVIAGSRYLGQIRKAKRSGIRIVQRLNGMNWTHKKTRTGIRHYFRAEGYNWLLSTIRRSLSDTIIYQSNFTQRWWTSVYGETKADHTVIYNGVDLDVYSPSQKSQPPSDRIRILVIEGHLGGGHELGFMNVVRFCREFQDFAPKPLELVMVGDVPRRLRDSLQNDSFIHWMGVVPRENIPEIIRTSHLYMPCEINAACPNSLIESLACGLPVAGFETGAIAELVGKDAGRIIPYGASDANLEPAKVSGLVQPVNEILNQYEKYKNHARDRAISEFNIEKMVDRYIQVLLK
jgi:glycosyltransferase involved in cell wall biosynthesis